MNKIVFTYWGVLGFLTLLLMAVILILKPEFSRIDLLKNKCLDSGFYTHAQCGVIEPVRGVR